MLQRLTVETDVSTPLATVIAKKTLGPNIAHMIHTPSHSCNVK